MSNQHDTYALADYITELTTPHTVTAHYVTRKGSTWIGQNHSTKAQSLLHQLAYSDPAKGAVEGDTAKAYTSSAIGRLEALDLIAHIRQECEEWLDDFGQAAPQNLADAIRLLGSLAPSADVELRKSLTRCVRRWWVQARIVTGWDSPAWQPDNTCPACDERRTVRIRLAERLASCVACRETWDESTISLLADHIRTENQQPHAARRDTACWCPTPLPFEITDRRFVCPRCGSNRCRWAIVARIDSLRPQEDTPHTA